jgi:hypothetical protein
VNLTRYVQRTQIELRTVFVLERGVATAFFLFQAITWPRRISSLSTPRNNSPTLSPASP